MSPSNNYDSGFMNIQTCVFLWMETSLSATDHGSHWPFEVIWEENDTHEETRSRIIPAWRTAG